MISLIRWCWQCLKSLIPSSKAPSSPTIIQAATAASSLWDQLPDDVAGKIFAKLRTGDRVRMSLVCKSWRRMAMREDIPVAPEAPWVIVSNDSYSKPEYSLTEISFKSLSEEKIYRFKLPLEKFGGTGGKRRRWCCCGSSRGWLLIAGGGDLQSMEMFLWNPISGATRKLPATSTIPFFNRLEDEGLDRISSFIARVQVFSVGSVECVVAVLLQNRADMVNPHDELAICTPQDQSWSVCGEGHKQRTYRDIFFHKGKLYASCRSETSTSSVDGTVIKKANYKIHLSGCDVEVDMLCLMYQDVSMDYLEGLNSIGFNVAERVQIVEQLVESATTGELLAVSAILSLCSYIYFGDQGPINTFRSTQTRGFEVRRLAGDCLEKLSGIGGQAIFVGATGSLSHMASADDDDRVVQADRIYFSTNNASGILGLDDESDQEEDDNSDDESDQEEDDEGDGEVFLNEVDNEDDEDGNALFIDPHPDRLYVVREQGVFDVQHNRIQICSLTNLRYKSESCTGWFTPKLFPH